MRWPAGYISPHSNQQNRAGNRFPLASRQGFCTPRRSSQPRRRSARLRPPSAVQSSRPPSSRPGGSPVETHNCTIPSQASTTPPPPTALLRLRVGIIPHMCLFQPSACQLEIHVEYYTAPLFVQTLPRMPPPTLSELDSDKQVVSLSWSSCVSPVELLTGEGGEGMGEEPNNTTARKPCPL
jgi:hypothetical protein